MLTVDSLEARLVRLSTSPRLTARIFAEVTYGKARFPLWEFVWGEVSLPTVIVVAGIHGDEPGGIEAALRLLETLADGANPLHRHRLIVLPCLNPSGLADGTRVNRLGQDINRQFHRDGTQVSAAVRRLLSSHEAAALVDLHTDAQTPGYYLFELRQEGEVSLGRTILETLAKCGYPIEEKPFFGGYRGTHGLFAPTPKGLAEFQRRASGLSLAELGLAAGIPRTYSFEAPYLEPAEKSAAMHVTALFALFAALEGELPTAAQTYPAAAQ